MSMFTKLAMASQEAEGKGKPVRTWYLTEEEVEQLAQELYSFKSPIKNYYDMYLAILDENTTIFGATVRICPIEKRELKREV